MPVSPENIQVRLYQIEAKYLEREPLIGKIINGSDMRHFSRSDLQSEQQQRNMVNHFDRTKPLQGLLELPRVLPTKASDATFYSPTARSLCSLATDYRSQNLVAPYSSTSKHLSSIRSSHFNAKMPILPRNTISLQPLEDTDFDSQEMKRSTSISAAGKNCAMVEQVRKMSSFEADYWACAIPDTLPPSPDRQSPLWNPNKEYEDLLDYTYPLRPKCKLAKNLKDSTVHDSGIDLESLSISPESTLKSMSTGDQEQQILDSPTAERLSTLFLKKHECSAVSHCRLSPIGKMSLADGAPSADGAVELSCNLFPRCPGPGPTDSTMAAQQDFNKKGHNYLLKREAARRNFMSSTRMLPLQKECSSDDEYLSLPPRLKELETLAQQLTELSLTIKKPEQGQVQDGFSCINLNGEQLLRDVQGDRDGKGSQWQLDCDSFYTCSFQERDLRDQSSKDHESEPRDIVSTNFLDMRTPEFLCVKQNKDHYRVTLAQCIKVFCCQLEELICWLHKVAEVIDHWIPPKPDIESVKASLQNYLEFKADLASHQARTEGVLRGGEKLLECMSSNSTVLQNTLGLIAKHSDVLKSHGERLYESILTATHTLDAGLMKNCDIQETTTRTKLSN